MPTSITFANIQDYLDAILIQALGDIDASPHLRFWDVAYQDFVSGSIPGTLNHGNPIPIIDPADPTKSAFLLILKAPWEGKRQMPAGGLLVTAPGYKTTLPDGTEITGEKILTNIEEWLGNGFPEA